MDRRKVTLTDEQGDILHGTIRYVASDEPAVIHANGHDLYEDVWRRNGWRWSFDPE